MKLLFLIPIWQRPRITEICFLGITRLRAKGVHSIDALAIVSEEEMKPLCDKHGIEWIFYKNQPLGEKKNFGVNEALKKDFDYLVELGSDDILKDEFLNLYTWDTPVMGLNDFIILNSKDGQCRRISGKVCPYGTGRAFSRRVVEMGDIWNGSKNRGLDHSATINLCHRGIMEKRFSSAEPLSIDIKSEVNLWAYRKIGKPYELEDALDGLSSEEKEMICSLVKNPSESLIER